MRGVKFFWWISINYTLVVLPRITKFGMVTQVVDKRVYKGWAKTPSHGEGAQSPLFFETPTYAQTIWSRVTKFGMIKHVGEYHVSTRSDTPPMPRWLCSQGPQNFWDLHIRTICENINQILHRDQIKLGVRKVLRGWLRMLTRDPFLVANLLVWCYSGSVVL